MRGSLTGGFLWSRWRRKRSRHSRRMRTPQFCVYGKRPMKSRVWYTAQSMPLCLQRLWNSKSCYLQDNVGVTKNIIDGSCITGVVLIMCIQWRFVSIICFGKEHDVTWRHWAISIYSYIQIWFVRIMNYTYFNANTYSYFYKEIIWF